MILPIDLTSGRQDDWGQKTGRGHLVTALGSGTWLVEMVSISAEHRNDGNRGWVRCLAVMEMGAWL